MPQYNAACTMSKHDINLIVALVLFIQNNVLLFGAMASQLKCLVLM